MANQGLLADLRQAIVASCQASQDDCRYRPSYILQMLAELPNAYEIVSRLILRADDVGTGFTRMWQCERDNPATRALDLTLEAIILRKEFDALFADEDGRVMREKARNRLRGVGYTRF